LKHHCGRHSLASAFEEPDYWRNGGLCLPASTAARYIKSAPRRPPPTPSARRREC
jgi:hypothetical protein